VTQENRYQDQFVYDDDDWTLLPTDRQARRGSKPASPKAVHRPRKDRGAVVAEVAEASGLEAGFNPSYRPSRYEEGWLVQSLSYFYDQHLITDVLAVVKGGKEATVYCCAAHPLTGESLFAAKVYRPRQFRSLRNDKMYREGRTILTADGRAVKKTDHRTMRAIGKKTAFGVQVEHTSWLMYEYTTMERLYAAGAAVPRPFAVAENAILMSYFGDANLAAPPLSDVRLERDEVETLFAEVVRNIELMLAHHLIHGDLSAYNILYWDGKITLIDFPQVTNSDTNPKAYAILRRDVTRVCEYFGRQGIRCDPNALTRELWARYTEQQPGEQVTDDIL
jgi:RIO kinase 1